MHWCVHLMFKKMAASKGDSKGDSQKYGYQKTITVGQYGRLAEFARSYGEELRRRTESDVSTTSASGPHSSSRRRHLWKRTKRVIINGCTACMRVVLPNMVEWIYLIALAILMASLGYFMDWLIQMFGTAHQKFYKLSDNAFAQYLLWVLFPIVFIFFSVGCCQIVSIHAIGSGIPEMKTVLRGIELHDYLSIRTLLAKALGLATAVGSSLPIGKEGPFVHMSSILAHTLGKLITRFNKSIYNEGHNYELLAAACALGVSSNFAAPIGGVLFSIEVTSTYFAVRNYWRGFFGAVVGSFLFQMFAVWFQEETGTITSLFKTNFRLDFPFAPVELLAFAFVGVICGVLAAFFVYFHRQCVVLLRKYRSKLRIRNVQILNKSIFVYPALLTVVMTTLTFPRGTGQWLGGELTQQRSIDHFFSNVTWNQIDSLETLNEDSFDFELATHWRNPSIFLTLSLFIVTRFFFAAFANTLPVPAGVFFPVFIVGAALGRLAGEVLDTMFPEGISGYPIGAGPYAVVGAAAMAGGVTHTISTSVIVFELTGQITHILPVMIAVLISNAIASLLQPSFYDSIILLKSLPFLPDLKTNRSYNLFACNFMQRQTVYISPHTSFGQLQHILMEEPQSSYPLIDDPESKVLLGSIRREYLADLLKQQLKPVRDHKRRILANYTGDEEDAMEVDLSLEVSPRHGNRRTSLPVRYRQVRQSLVNRFLSTEDESAFSDIEVPSDLEGSLTFPLELTTLENELLAQTIRIDDVNVDPAPFQLVEETSLYKAHSLFALLGLSHSFVTKNGKLVGVVTLEDLVTAVKQGDAIRQDPRYMPSPEQEMRQMAGARGVHGDDDDEHSPELEPLSEESESQN